MMKRVMGAAELRRNMGLFTIIDVARKLGIKESTFYEQIESEWVPRPTTKIGRGRRCYYTASEVNELKKRMKRPE
jgi:predicted DNA-binding transcriptional regulator AlpA